MMRINSASPNPNPILVPTVHLMFDSPLTLPPPPPASDQTEFSRRRERPGARLSRPSDIFREPPSTSVTRAGTIRPVWRALIQLHPPEYRLPRPPRAQRSPCECL